MVHFVLFPQGIPSELIYPSNKWIQFLFMHHRVVVCLNGSVAFKTHQLTCNLKAQATRDKLIDLWIDRNFIKNYFNNELFVETVFITKIPNQTAYD